jgi:C4-dicarboxylate transporter DctQ subunit
MWIPYLALPLAFLSAAYRVSQKIIELIKTPPEKIRQVSEHEMIIEETKLNLGEDV